MVFNPPRAQGESEIRELLEEFNDMADRLMMPDAERRAIIGMTHKDWRACCRDLAIGWSVLDASHLRRLSYVLPLMHRVAANHDLAMCSQTLSRVPHDGRRPH